MDLADIAKVEDTEEILKLKLRLCNKTIIYNWKKLHGALIQELVQRGQRISDIEHEIFLLSEQTRKPIKEPTQTPYNSYSAWAAELNDFDDSNISEMGEF